jgi:hypothetical protein
MELHARLINAATGGATARNVADESYLPPGFKFFSSIPKPAADCEWAYDNESQLFFARRKGGGKDRIPNSELRDGVKYLRDVGRNGGGWEIGYNHYVGRLGLRMPETQRLLQRKWPDWYEFHWGLGTLTHADSAALLWRPGVRRDIICRPPAAKL